MEVSRLSRGCRFGIHLQEQDSDFHAGVSMHTYELWQPRTTNPPGHSLITHPPPTQPVLQHGKMSCSVLSFFITCKRGVNNRRLFGFSLGFSQVAMAGEVGGTTAVCGLNTVALLPIRAPKDRNVNSHCIDPSVLFRVLWWPRKELPTQAKAGEFWKVLKLWIETTRSSISHPRRVCPSLRDILDHSHFYYSISHRSPRLPR